MQKYLRILSGLTVIVTLLAMGIACGGGGSSGRRTPIDTAAGKGFKGPVIFGQITGYGLPNNSIEDIHLINTTTTDAEGRYFLPLAGFQGNVLIELSGGTYEDEATGDIKENRMLRAIVPGVSNSVSVMVTPFTEIAYRIWEARLGTPEELTISQANAAVSYIAGVADIIATEPVLATDGEKSSKALKSQTEYGLAAAMLSVYAKNFHGEDMEQAIDAIVEDLLDNMQLDNTGEALVESLDEFLKDPIKNRSGTSTLNQTFIDDTLRFMQETGYAPLADLEQAEINEARRLVSDIRDTALVIYNYTDSGYPGLIDSFYTKVAREMKDTFPHELPEKLYVIIEAAMYLNLETLFDGIEQTIPLNETTWVTFNYEEVEQDFLSLGFTLTENNEVTAEGTVSYIGNIPGEPQSPTDIFNMLPLQGTIAGTFTTGEALATVDIEYLLSLTSLLRQVMTLETKGETKISDGQEILHSKGTTRTTIQLSFDGSVYPSEFISEGTVILGTTAEIEGTSVITFVETFTGIEEITFIPDSVSITGSITELDSPSPTFLTGTLTGTLENADTFIPSENWTAANFPEWTATFNGNVSKPGFPSVQVLVSARQVSHDRVIFGNTGYHRTDADGKTVFLQGNGTYVFPENLLFTIEEPLWKSDFGQIEWEFANQKGTKLYLTSDWEKEGASILIGHIYNPGGEITGTVILKEKGPFVIYEDGYGEYVFPIM